MKRVRIASIDVGATKIATVMADENGAGDLRILGVGVAASQGMEKGMIVNTRQAVASISQSVKKAEKMAGYRLKSACVGISGPAVSSVNSRGAISIPRSNQLVQAADRKRALEVACSVEVPGGQRLLHVIPRSYTLDGQGNIKNPVGMHGFRLNVETHIVTANVASVKSLTKCVRSLGISINGLVLKSLASAEATLAEDEKENGVVLADIGSDTTDIAFFKDGSVYHTLTLPVGGRHVTHDIAVGLGLPLDLAEVIKKKHGNVMMSEARDSCDVTVTENGCSVSYHDLGEIISARIEEFFRLILLQMPSADYAKAIPSGLVITGGNCDLPGIVELGRAITQLPVRVGYPPNLDGGDDMLCDPAYATSVGLLYWKMKGDRSQDNWGKRGGLGVLLPRWLGYLSSQSRQLNRRLKEMKNGENKLRAQPSEN